MKHIHVLNRELRDEWVSLENRFKEGVPPAWRFAGPGREFQFSEIERLGAEKIAVSGADLVCWSSTVEAEDRGGERRLK